MYKKILAPLDGSKLAERILGHVKAIATGCSVPEVVLLRVLPTPRAADVYMAGQVYETGKEWRPDIKEKMEAEVMEYLSKIAADLKEDGIAAKTTVAWGDPAEKIVDYITNNQIDLVIMNSRGRSGTSRWLFGSVAEKVVRHSPAPVLTGSPSAFRE